MKILKIGHIENYARCAKCGAELQYDKHDLRWSHTEEKCYYIVCPICGGIIWIDGTPELDKMYHEAWAERRLAEQEQ